MDLLFFLNSALLGVGLAMDAFSVSVANGLSEPNMKKGRMNLIAGTFAGFQFAMPVIGWICVHTIVEYFNSFRKFTPWIALILLAYIGGKMVIEGAKNLPPEEKPATDGKTLFIMGVATSIDALSVGFTIADYDTAMALIASLIIAIVTYAICMGGIFIGKKFGNKLSNRAEILGGVILIGIGLEIFIKSFL